MWLVISCFRGFSPSWPWWPARCPAGTTVSCPALTLQATSLVMEALGRVLSWQTDLRRDYVTGLVNGVLLGLTD